MDKSPFSTLYCNVCVLSTAFESSDLSGELCDGKPTCMGNADVWAAFPQDVGDEGRDLVGQWWPEEASTDTVCHELVRRLSLHGSANRGLCPWLVTDRRLRFAGQQTIPMTLTSNF